jgi:hypothetical protein
MQAVIERPHWAAALSLLVMVGLSGPANFYAKNSSKSVDENDVTLQLFRLLDDSYGGKFDDYVLADLYTDAASGQEYRHILHVDYDKNRAFGRLNLCVRGVAKMTPEQLAVYTPKEIYDFAKIDLEKFFKTAPGPFGASGDLYLRSVNGGALANAAINNEAQKRYTDIVSQYVIPALEKPHKTP